MTAGGRRAPLLLPWTALLIASAILAAGFEAAGVPAGLLLGPMVAAIGFAGAGQELALPPPASMAGQSIVGLLIATSFSPALLRTVTDQPLLFAGVTAATLATGVGIGILLTRWQVLPGSAALWGSMPGAATAMTLMARTFDADEQLVAVMTFSRVACVALLASVIALALGGGGNGGDGPGAGWFPAIDAARFGATLTVAVIGAVAGRLLRLPAGALLGPLILGAGLALAGALRVELPGWLLAAAYTLVGWRIGLAFTRPALRTAIAAAPGILAAIGSLIAVSAGIGGLLAWLTGRDLLTCYLATSPGGADSIAIIAAETPVDVPFVMAMQVLRFVAVLALGPAAARLAARRMNAQPAGDGRQR